MKEHEVADDSGDFTNARDMEKLTTQESWAGMSLVSRLVALQAIQNAGRGISSVQTLISFLNAGDAEAA